MNKIDISIFIIFIVVVLALIFIKITKFNNSLNNQNIDRQIDNLRENTREDFIVADALDNNNYSNLRNQVLAEEDNFNKERIDNFPINEVADYNNKKDDNYQIMVVNGDPPKEKALQYEKSFITATDFGWDNPFPVVSCSNASINNRFKSGSKKLLPRDISCGFPNKLTAENYYKTHYQAQVAKLEDYAVRGANYMEFSNYIHPTKSNIRILSQNTKGLPSNETKYRNIPSGYNYGFHNSPAMALP